ncbi:MAG: heavy metal translocating P-type ATPase, partial [Actinomycetota bacterium]
LNKVGMLKCEATKVGSDTTLMQIVKMVEEAQAASAPIQRLADKAASYFVPAILIAAFLTLIGWLLIGNPTLALLSFIAVLIIACPCALGIATPAAMMAGVGKGAEMGILIRGGEYLERAQKLKTVVFDKTGTLTKGEPSVTDIIVAQNEERRTKSEERESGRETGSRGTLPRTTREVLYYAAIAEKSSEHPLAEAILNRATSEGLEIPDHHHFEAVPGLGVKAKYNGKEILFGNRKLMKENSIDIAPLENQLTLLEEQGKTAMILSLNKKPMGIIAAADTIKEYAPQAVKKLKEEGVDVVMLTGDNERTAHAIAKQVGIDHVIANVLPWEKSNVIKKLQEEGQVVSMVGDGINDAPALAQADIGIAIGSGSDIAKETGGIILIKDDIRDVVTGIKLSKATMGKIKQNLFWAFFYNSAAIPVAAFGLLNPIIAAATMALSSLSVVSNAALLKRFKVEI